MYPMYSHCVFNLNPRACSIDTPLHTFVPYQHVDHLHPNAVIAIAASVNQERLCREIYGDDVIYVPWQRPGFDIGLMIEELIAANPKAKGVLLGHHGMSSWSNDDKTCYETALEIIDRAAAYIEQRDRGEKTFGGQKYAPLADRPPARDPAPRSCRRCAARSPTSRRFVGTVQDDEKMLRFVNSVDAPRLAALGTSCPDHFLRTKIKPLFVDWNPETGDVAALAASLPAGLEQYRKDYAAYYERCKRPDSPAMRDPNPTVVLIPGLGMIAWGKNKSESRVTAEFYNCAIEVMRGAEAIDQYEAMDQQEAFDIEYWSLEEAKLRRLPPEKELDRQVVGRDRRRRGHRQGHGAPAGARRRAPGLRRRGRAAGAGDGAGDRREVRRGHRRRRHAASATAARRSASAATSPTARASRGCSAMCCSRTAASTPSSSRPASSSRRTRSGRVDDAQWAQTFGINVTGAYIVADEAYQDLQAAEPAGEHRPDDERERGRRQEGEPGLRHEQGRGQSPGARAGGRDGAARARERRGAGDGREGQHDVPARPGDRVAGQVRALPFGEDESTEALRDKLAGFYAKRSLTQSPIEPEDQAEAIFLLVSQRLAKTTGPRHPGRRRVAGRFPAVGVGAAAGASASAGVQAGARSVAGHDAGSTDAGPDDERTV